MIRAPFIARLWRRYQFENCYTYFWMKNLDSKKKSHQRNMQSRFRQKFGWNGEKICWQKKISLWFFWKYFCCSMQTCESVTPPQKCLLSSSYQHLIKTLSITASSPSCFGEPAQIAQILAALAATVSASLQLRSLAAGRSAWNRAGLSTSEDNRCIKFILSRQSAFQAWTRRWRSICCKSMKNFYFTTSVCYWIAWM